MILSRLRSLLSPHIWLAKGGKIAWIERCLLDTSGMRFCVFCMCMAGDLKNCLWHFYSYHVAHMWLTMVILLLAFLWSVFDQRVHGAQIHTRWAINFSFDCIKRSFTTLLYIFPKYMKNPVKSSNYKLVTMAYLMASKNVHDTWRKKRQNLCSYMYEEHILFNIKTNFPFSLFNFR